MGLSHYVLSTHLLWINCPYKWAYFWGFYSVQFIYESVFMPVLYYFDIPHLCSTDQNQGSLYLQNRLMVAKGEGEGMGWTGIWGLVDANYCIWSG